MLNTEGLCLGCMSDNGGERICPICGFDNLSKNPTDCLPLKSYIQNRYFIGKALKTDGEGITYIGWDKAKSTKVKIKEYFPSGFALRNPDKTVSIPTEGRYTFNEGLMEFMDVNRSIMISTLPSLMPIYDVFEENGTAYCVSELISGITLEEFLIKNGGALKWEQARPLFLPVIDTLNGMNEIGYIHGGISTETIIVGRDGKLRISDFSIKKLRRADSELEASLYEGFASCEQYGINEIKNDTYTDVYGLCATLFRVLIGNPPPPAPQRLTNDVMTIPARFAEELPRQVLAALANGLQILPQNRTRTVETFKNEFIYGEIDIPVTEERPTPKAVTKAQDISSSKKPDNNSVKYVVTSALITVGVLLVIAVILCLTVFKDSIFSGKNDNSSDNIISVISHVNEDIESIPSIPIKTFEVPDLSGKYFSEITEEDAYEMFQFEIKEKVHSNQPKGTVCKQSIKAGTQKPRDTKIILTISLGPKEVIVPNLSGLTETEAKLELLKQGFLYENIKVLEKYDEESEPATVLDQSPKYGEKLSIESIVEIYINSYKGEEISSDSSPT